MKQIDIKRQPSMGFGRTLSITNIGIRYRLFRSLVTVVVISVAVAFSMNIVSEGLIKRRVARQTANRLAELRAAAVWATRLSNPGTPDEILESVGAADPDAPVCREAQRMGRLSDDQFNRYYDTARQAEEYLAFMTNLEYTQRRRLVHAEEGMAMFDYLRDPERFEHFQAELKTMKSIRFPNSVEKFREFLAQWETLKDLTLKIHRGRIEAVAQINGNLGKRSLIDHLREAEGSFGKVIRDAGFHLDPTTAERLARQARRMYDMRRVEAALDKRPVIQGVAAQLDLLPSDVTANTFWPAMTGRSRAEWLHNKLASENLPAASISVDRIIELAETKAEMETLEDAERAAGDVAGGVMGIGERMSWLVFVSMVVCVVGITNAMLMSVTERFREIATLKCLGALDGSIMLMFVLEACLLGVVGGAAGALVGMMIAAVRMLFSFGSALAGAIPVGELVVAGALAAVIGVILAALAAVYPSFKAARLAPMEAMRIE